MGADDPDLLLRRISRERNARLEAEAILESKSLELHEAKLAAESAAQELKNRNVQIQAIVDNAAEGIITLDADLKITSFNSAATRIFRIESDAAIGSDFDGLFTNLDTVKLRGFIDSQLDRLEPIELNSRSDDVRDRTVEVTLSKTVGFDGNSMIAIVRDRTKRKQLESQLAIAQKMESIGQLSAGIAHEINSPMQYVSDNTRFLKDAFTDINNLLQKYDRLVESVKENPKFQAIVEEITEQYESADMDFTLVEVPLAIDQTIAGTERVNTIVQAMKIFSHPGETDVSTFDMNEALMSTVAVAKNEWKYVAEVELKLDESLPMCNGYPSEINQAFLNLIVNAAHAIGKRIESEPHHKGMIRIETRRRDEYLQIEIEDNGCGIPEEHLTNIYVPFFTTKPVGKGTGQGLSIAHSIIVESHGGSIDLQSEVGKGTRFVLEIPISFEVKQNPLSQEIS